MTPPSDLKFPPDIEKYLPPDLWRKLASGDPQRRLLIQALDRLRSLVYLLSTFIPSNIVQDKLKQATPGFVKGEMLSGSLLFADVSGFTALSERLASLGPEGAERLTTTMNDYFGAMLDVVASSGGILLKFAGDAMLVYFPEQEKNQQAQWAVRAGMRMLRAIEEFAHIETPVDTASLKMKVGVSTGNFLSASVGSAKRMEYAILGEAIAGTMAAEGAASGPGQLVISQSTADCLDVASSLQKGSPGFYLVDRDVDEEIDGFEIRAERRRARGTIPLDASPEALVAQMAVTLDQILVLKPYIAEELVERIIAHAQARKVESEFLTATVLFCNFVGPEFLLERWGSDGISRVTNLLSSYFNMVSDVITRYGGIITRIDPYSKGTKLLALFGAPVSHQDDPMRAVRAALMMNVELELLNERWRSRIARHLPVDLDGPLIQHCIGITVGETFAGQVGSINRREYTVMGDDVNLSARLMGASEMGQILISQPVYEAVARFFFLSELSPIRVKGKSKTIPIYQVDGPRTDTLLNRVQQRGKLVGNELELSRGEDLLEKVFDGECVSLTIQGPAGIGKSHLADVLLQRAISRGAEVLSYQCNSYNAEISFACWSGILRSLAGITSTDPVLLHKEKLGRLISELEIPDQHVPHLARLVGLTALDASEMLRNLQGEAEPEGQEDLLRDILRGRRVRRQGRGMDLLNQLEGGQISETKLPTRLNPKEKNALFEALSSLLLQVLSRSPLVLFFEDAHWMDEASRNMLPSLAENLGSQSLLILSSQRGEEDQSPEGQTIRLKPLDEGGTARLVAEVLFSDLADIIHQHSKGNPLFIREIGAWVQQKWQISTSEVVSALQTSDVLQNLVLSNLKNLPESQREIARVGSVIGEEFRVGEMQALLPVSVDTVTLHNDLRELAETGVISLIEAGIDPRYAFQQKLVRDILYQSLPFARRRALHTQMAEYLVSPTTHRSALHEKIGAFLNTAIDRNPIRDAKIVAFHYETAEDWGKAAQSLMRVAGLLEEQGAHSEAIQTYDRARYCLKNLPTVEIGSELRELEQSLFEGRGDSALLSGDYSLAVSSYKDALTNSEDTETSEGTADLRWKLALVLPMVDQANEAKHMLQRLLIDKDDSPKSLAVSATLTWLYWRAAKDEISPWIEKSKALLPENPERWYLGVEALLDDLAGQWVAAAEKYIAIDQPVGAALASIRLGDQILRDGAPEANKQYQDAQGIFSELLAGEREIGLALANYRLAEYAWRERDADAARESLKKVESLLDACPARIREEGRDLIIRALEVINAGSTEAWPDWHWGMYDDGYKINLLFQP